MRAAYADNPDVELILLADRSEKSSDNATTLGEDFTDARLYRVHSGACERLDGGPQFPEITTSSRFEPDSADPETLRKFLAYVVAYHPARYRALMLYGHADGRAMCPDEDSGHERGFAQLTDVVPSELSVDLTALELCNMGGIEIAYQWSPRGEGFSTHELVAIPNAGPPLDWGRVFARLHAPGAPGASGTTLAASLTPAQLGELIVEEGAAGRRALAEQRAAALPAREVRRLHHLPGGAGCELEALPLVHAAASRGRRRPVRVVPRRRDARRRRRAELVRAARQLARQPGAG